jgi:hypothetical protein
MSVVGTFSGYLIPAMSIGVILSSYTQDIKIISVILVIVLFSHLVGYVDGYIEGIEEEYKRVK